MQLNKNRRSAGALAKENIIISFLCAFAPLRDKIRANSCALVVQTDNTRQFPGKPNAKNLISRNEPNFRKETYTLTHEITKDYNRLHRNHHPKNEPNTNPIRTQYEPNSNPIRTQTNPISCHQKRLSKILGTAAAGKT